MIGSQGLWLRRIVSVTALLAFMACGQRYRASAPQKQKLYMSSELGVPLDSTCSFVRKSQHPEPRSLASEFVARASRAEFAESESWMSGAVTCVGHEPGYDTFVVADSFALAFLDSSQHRVRMTLRLAGRGTESGGQFQSERKVYVDTLHILETRYGWRIDDPF